MSPATRTLWLDLSGGVAGDMLLGACLDARVPLQVIQRALDRLDLPERVTIRPQRVLRSGIAATHAVVEVSGSPHHRRLSDILTLLERLDEPVRSHARATFEVLAEAESRVHALTIDEVHFHEVGALDSIADVVGVTAAMAHLDPERTIASPIALGGGRASTAHGSVPVPGPAVTQLLASLGLPAFGGPVNLELATPTGVALICVLADDTGPMPPMITHAVGTGAGTRDPHGHANVLRVLSGVDQPATAPPPTPAAEISSVEDAVVLEANVDDLDPRLWPAVLSALMEAGAADAWLTPVLMKKGRPAHSLSILCSSDVADTLARIVLTRTSTIGLRRHRTDKLVLDRETSFVEVLGGRVGVKVARLHGQVVNISVEYDDLAEVATARGCSEKGVLAEATRAAADRWPLVEEPA